MAQRGLLPWHPTLREKAEALSAVDEADMAGIGELALARLESFLGAIQRYRDHPYRRSLDPPTTAWQSGEVRLYDYGGKGRPVLFVPSLVNRAYVLDLSLRRSLIRFLVARGHHIFLLDWSAPGATERRFSLTDYVAGPLVAAIHRIVAEAGAPLHLVGYCMGGNLALAAAALAPNRVHRLALLATPWDFHAEGGEAAQALGAPGSPLLALADSLGELPVDALQTLFVALDPVLALRKFRAFARLEPASAEEEDFVAIEDWLNDGVPLTARVARECLSGWYGANDPVRRRWQVAGQTVDPALVTVPTLVVVPDRDRIVPPGSAKALAAQLPADLGHVLEPKAGHIGMVVGSRAETGLWRPLADWLRS
jgi:polyhydroxyalkanoate synthase